MPTEQFQLSPASVEARFQRLQLRRQEDPTADDPLFRPIDADDFRVNGASASDFSTVREHGLVRITMRLPPNVKLIDREKTVMRNQDLPRSRSVGAHPGTLWMSRVCPPGFTCREVMVNGDTRLDIDLVRTPMRFAHTPSELSTARTTIGDSPPGAMRHADLASALDVRRARLWTHWDARCLTVFVLSRMPAMRVQ